MIPERVSLSTDELARWRRDGFLVLESFVAEEAAVKRLCDTLGLDLKDLKQPVKRRHDDPDEDDEDDPVDDKDE